MAQNQNSTSGKYIPSDADYEKAETDLLRTALKRTYTERFHTMTRLMKMNEMFKKAKIIRTPYTFNK